MRSTSCGTAPRTKSLVKMDDDIQHETVRETLPWSVSTSSPWKKCRYGWQPISMVCWWLHHASGEWLARHSWHDLGDPAVWMGQLWILRKGFHWEARRWERGDCVAERSDLDHFSMRTVRCSAARTTSFLTSSWPWPCLRGSQSRCRWQHYPGPWLWCAIWIRNQTEYDELWRLSDM